MAPSMDDPEGGLVQVVAGGEEDDDDDVETTTTTTEGADIVVAAAPSTDNDPESGGGVLSNAPSVSADEDDDNMYDEKEDVIGSLPPTTNDNNTTTTSLQQLFAPPLQFRDHHSLKGPSSSLVFQKKRYQIYPQRNSEFVLQQDRRTGKIVARQGKDGSIGLSFLRFLYAVVAVFMMGFVFVFCLQLLLFLFLGLTVSTGLTSSADMDWSQFFGTLLSVPLFVYSLACALALCAAFVGDAWNGHAFLDKATSLKGVPMQWINFCIFLGIPILVAICSLFARAEEWWKYTALTWFSCVFFLYCVFCVLVIYYEIMGTLELIRKYEKYTEVDSSSNLMDLLKYTLQMRQIQRFSGRVYRKYIIDGETVFNAKDSCRDRSMGDLVVSESTSTPLYTKLTQWNKLQDWGLVVDTDDVRQYSIDETRDVAPFVTADTWSLEKLFCRSRNKRFIAVINGKNALTHAQLTSSFACALIGNVLVILFVGSFLTWGGLSVGGVVFIIALATIAMSSSILQTVRLYDMVKRHRLMNRKKNDEVLENEIVYQVMESYRINKITPKVCWTLLALEVVVFYVWPVVTLFVIGNHPIAIFFLVSGIISLVRHYFNAASVLMEVGDINVLDEELTKMKSQFLAIDQSLTTEMEHVVEEDFHEKARLNLIVGKISHGNRRNVWIFTFAALVGIFCVLFLGAYALGSNEGSGTIPTSLPRETFVYEKQGAQDALPYPTCRMSSDIAIPGEEDTALMDYTFLSVIAYSDSDCKTLDGTPTDPTQEYLDNWFGAGFAKDEDEVVREYRERNDVSSAVQFKLISFNNLTVQTLDREDGFAVLTIRGTNNGWDALSDAQLWSAAWLAQAVRFVLPFGEIWTPILENLIYAISQIQSSSLKNVAYYKETKDFVEFLKQDSQFRNLRITGHSLGGGLAAITGAQTNTPAIALSGPNNMLSRNTFDPQLTKEQLDTLVFNIIPDKDPVPRIDDVAQLYQRIHCTASDANFVDCHTSTRSLCDILVTCGNKPRYDRPGRPTFCMCHDIFGYPQPTAKGNQTYADACSSAK